LPMGRERRGRGRETFVQSEGHCKSRKTSRQESFSYRWIGVRRDSQSPQTFGNRLGFRDYADRPIFLACTTAQTALVFASVPVVGVKASLVNFHYRRQYGT
jgi:hypothetical protein